ncbi:MAG: hypothetical protein OEY34_06630, partial [Cyclobacteriaceae bacterium]|nr:hypothetical protein [Cyclobacteriaceae bacterium]
EQTTSAVFAQLFLEELMNLNNDRKSKIEININAAIDRLRLFQLASGGFGYWPGANETNSWGTNYAGHFLLLAKSKGYNVPDGLLNGWKQYQKQEAASWRDNSSSSRHTQLDQAYRLYTLALAGEKPIAEMNRMKLLSGLSIEAKWRLALAYALSGQEDVAKEMVTDISFTVLPYKGHSFTYGSKLRDDAMILETMARLDMNTEAFKKLTEIAETMGDKNEWMSTQTTAYCLIGASAYAKKFNAKGESSIKILVDNKNVKVSNDKYVTQIGINEPGKNHTVKITNEGSIPVYIRTVRKGIPLEGFEEAGQSNIRFNVAYTDMDGKPIDVMKLKQGTDFMAVVEVVNPGTKNDYEELAITHIFPSGWEIINTRMQGTEFVVKQDNPEYQDIRDDRVLTYFDLDRNQKKTFKVLLNASYRGKFYLPSTSVEAMYDNSIYGRTAGKWVQVVTD